MLQPPVPADIYTQIKKGTLGNFGMSNEHRLRKLIKGEVVNSKPSFVLSPMRNIANGQCRDEVMRSLFIERLPTLHRQILALSSNKNLTELALIADKITDEIQAHSKSEKSTSIVSAIEKQNSDLMIKIDAIVNALANLKGKFYKTNRGRSYHRSDIRNQSRLNSRNNRSRNHSRSACPKDICWYHWKFEEKCLSDKCKSPCNWSQKHNSGKA